MLCYPHDDVKMIIKNIEVRRSVENMLQYLSKANLVATISFKNKCLTVDLMLIMLAQLCFHLFMYCSFYFVSLYKRLDY